MLGDWATERIESIDPARIVVGVSGGVDSVVLLHLAVQAFGTVRVHALHVHHGLNAAADDWQACCERHCAGLGIELSVHRVAVERTGNLESNARRARYEAFESSLAPGDVLLLGHHRDDQVETILHTLFRGSARFGVTGMPRERSLGGAVLLRPLIDVSRADIECWATERGFEWIEDPANADEAFTRNYLRHTIIPALESRWPGAAEALLEAASRDEEYRQIIDFAGEIDERDGREGSGLAVAALVRLPLARRDNVVRHVLDRFGLPQPGAGALRQGLDDLIHAPDDAAPVLAWQGIALRRFAARLFVVRDDEAGAAVSSASVPRAGSIEFGGGTLSIESGSAVIQRDDYVARTRSSEMEVRIRHRRPVKKLMQEIGLPPWLRDRVPVLCAGDVVVAIPALPDWGIPMVVADGHAPQSGESGLALAWRAPGQPYTD